MQTVNQITGSIQLQGIGRVNAKPAAELVVGDVTVWNYGYPATVEGIARRGRHVIVTLRDNASGSVADRRMLDTRLVAIRQPKVSAS